MDQNWKTDPLLKKMSQEKMDFLNRYAESLAGTPKERLITAFLTMQNEAKQKKITFSNEESELMIQIMGSHMNPEEKQRMDTFASLAKKLTARS